MRKGLLLLLALVAAPAAASSAGAARTVLLVLRSLSYDRALAERSAGALHLAVISGESKRAECAEVAAAFREAAFTFSVGGMAVQLRELHHTDMATTGAALQADGVTAAFVCEGLGGGAAEIAALARAQKISTFTNDEDALRQGLCLGTLRRGATTQLMVDLTACKAQGTDLAPDLLRSAVHLR